MADSEYFRHDRNTSSPADMPRAVEELKDSFVTLNNKLSNSSPSYDSLVVFSAEPHSNIATPLLTLDALNGEHDHTFRDTSIMGRALVLPGTTVGDVLKGRDVGFYAGSNINTAHNQLTHTEILHAKGKQVAAVQYSYSAPKPGGVIEHLPEDVTVSAIWENVQTHMAHAAMGILSLQRAAHELRSPLSVELEQQEAIAPNGFPIRWDVEGATEMALDSRRPKLQKFLNRAHIALSGLAADYANHPEKSSWNIRDVYDNQGDGAYIILPLPEYFNPYDKRFLEDYRTFVAQRFMDDMSAQFKAINAGFEDIDFNVNITGDFAFIEPDSTGRLDSSVMYALAARQKEK